MNKIEKMGAGYFFRPPLFEIEISVRGMSIRKTRDAVERVTWPLQFAIRMGIFDNYLGDEIYE